jgi:tetratricopeptide (TPR) repeat protein
VRALTRQAVCKVIRRSIYFGISFFLLLLYPLAWESLYFKSQLTGLFMLVSGGIIWLICCFRTRNYFYIPKVILPVVALIVFQFLSVLHSASPQQGLRYLIIEVSMLLFFIFFLDSSKLGWENTIWENVLFGLGMLFSVIEILRVGLWYRNWWMISGSPFSRPPIGYLSDGLIFWHANTMAGFFSLILPILFIRFIRCETSIRKAVVGTMIILFLVTEYYSSSRAAWIAALGGTAISIWMLYKANLKSRLGGLLKKPRISISARVLFTSSAIVVIVVGVALLIADQLYITPQGPLSDRLFIWKTALETFVDAPVWGSGLGSFIVEYSRRALVSPGFPYIHAHNFWLQVSAELGMLGVLLVLLIVVWFVWIFYSAWKSISFGDPKRYQLAGYAGGLVALAIHQMVDFLIGQLLYGLISLLLIALVIQFAPRRDHIKLSNRPAAPILVGILGICALGSCFFFRGQRAYEQGLNAARNGDWLAARDMICEAAEINDFESVYDFQCSLANAQIAYLYDDSSLEDAVAYQREGLSRDPNLPVNWANLASYEWELGDRIQALADMRIAVSMDPGSNLFLLNLGRMDEKSGEQAEAIRVYGQALHGNPGLKKSNFFHITDLRIETASNSDINYQDYSAVLPDNVDQSVEQDLKSALRATPAQTGLYAALALVQNKLGKFDEAWQSAQNMMFINSSSIGVLNTSALIAFDQGKKDESYRYLERSLNFIENYQLPGIYYVVVYHRDSLATDLSPYLQRAFMSPEMIENFNRFAQHLADTGEWEKRVDVLRMIERESVP